MTKEQLKELVDKLIITDTSVYAYYTDEKHADALKNLTVKDLKNNGLITLVSATEFPAPEPPHDPKVNTPASADVQKSAPKAKTTKAPKAEAPVETPKETPAETPAK